MRKWEMVKPIYRVWVADKKTIAFKATLLGIYEVGIDHEWLLFPRRLAIIIVRESGTVKQTRNNGRPQFESARSRKLEQVQSK